MALLHFVTQEQILNILSAIRQKFHESDKDIEDKFNELDETIQENSSKSNEAIQKLEESVLPPKGTTGQFLIKSSNKNYDVEWKTLDTWQGGDY